MGSVHEDVRGRSKFWYGAYTTAAGQRRMVSTKIEIGKTKKEQSKSREAALAVVRAWEKAEGLACAGTITKTRIEEILNQTLRTVGLQEIESKPPFIPAVSQVGIDICSSTGKPKPIRASQLNRKESEIKS